MKQLFFGTGAVALSIWLGAMSSDRLQAQGPAPSTAAAGGTTFEAASVKPNKSGDNRISFQMVPGRFTATGAPLAELVRFAFQIQPVRIIGLPDWSRSERFDIVGKLEGGPTPGAVNDAMRALLADRFKLSTHLETRELPIYALVLARNDGKLGPQLQAASVDCAARRGGPPPSGRAAGPPAPPPIGQRPDCGMFGGPDRVAAGGTPLSQLATMLSQRVNRIVEDHTGLAGNYDFTLQFTPDQSQLPQGPLPPGVTAPNIDPNGPSLFTALQEQLGLKLDSRKAQVDVLVIDSISLPTED